MKTMTDDTTSKLSELLMQGTNMGIIEGRRLINQNSDIAPDVENILNDFNQAGLACYVIGKIVEKDQFDIYVR